MNKTLTLYTGIDNIFDKKIEEELGTNVGAYYFAGAKLNSNTIFLKKNLLNDSSFFLIFFGIFLKD